jgi:hypothetical protein
LTRGGMPVNTAEAYDEDDEDDLSSLFSMDSWVGSSSDDSSEDGDKMDSLCGTGLGGANLYREHCC